MSYGVKYRVEYKDSAGVDKKIDIEERDFVGDRTDVDAGDDPLNIELPANDPIYPAPVATAGCTINMISATNMQFIGLYSIDPQKIRVRIYAGGSSIPYFTGYANTEVYGESYARLQDYDAYLYCNDGFATLERYKYLNGTAKYDTLETMWNVLTRIITKMGLPFQYLYFACRHSCDGVTPGTSETLWHNLKIDQQNYYDEQDEPMTHRQVLEALLMPFGLQIRWLNGSLLVFEVQMLYGSNFFGVKRFDSSFAYVDAVNLAFNYDISNGEINWDGEDQVFDKKGGFSKQKIRYSPYAVDGIVKNKDLANRYEWTGTEIWDEDAYGVWRMTGITAVSGFTLTSAGVHFAGHKVSFEASEEDIYIECSAGGLEWIISTDSDYNVAEKAGQLLEISGQIYIKTRNNEFDTSQNSWIVRGISMPCVVLVDGKGPHRVDSDWQWDTGYTEDSICTIRLEPGETTLCDRWLTFKTWVPFNMPGGKAVLKIGDPKLFANFEDTLDDAPYYRKVRFKNIDVKAYAAGTIRDRGLLIEVQNAKEITGNDISYSGDLNEAFINEAEEITLHHSDGENMTDRGAIRKLDGSFPSGWSKGGGTSYRLTDLLLRLIISQYRDSLNTLNGTIEAGALMQSNGGPAFVFTLQDSDNLGSCKLMFTGGTYNDFYRTLNGSFLEIKLDDLSIALV